MCHCTTEQGSASDEEVFLYHIMHGDAEIRKIRPPKTYLTGKEPLTVLIRELSKDKDISRLHLQKDKIVFDFRQT